jgi:hypothetical protein
MTKYFSDLFDSSHCLFYSSFFSWLLNAFAAFRFATLLKTSQERQRTFTFPFVVMGVFTLLSKIFYLPERFNGKYGLSFFLFFSISLVSWIFVFFKNFMEYFLLLPSLVIWANGIFLFLSKIYVEMCPKIFIVFAIGSLLAIVVSTILLIWFRLQYLTSYKIYSACIVSFSSISLFHAREFRRNVFICACMIHLIYTAFIARLGIYVAKRNNSEESKN